MQVLLSSILACSLCLLPLNDRHESSFFDRIGAADYIAVVVTINTNLNEKARPPKILFKQILKSPKSKDVQKEIETAILAAWMYEKVPDDIPCFVFAKTANGNTSFHALALNSKEAVSYLQGVVNATNRVELLRFSFGYLQHKDIELAEDAELNFRRAIDRELFAAKSVFNAEQLRKWIGNQSLKHYQIETFIKLLGYCGNADDVVLLRSLLLQRKKDGHLIENCLTSLIDLDKKAGWKLADDCLRPTEPFGTRYGVLKAMRQFKKAERQLPSDENFRSLIDEGLKNDDIADLFIEDLRRWKMWGYSAKVVSLYKQDVPGLVKKSIIRFVLQSPEPRSQAFLTLVRRSNPEMVKDCEEILQLEKDAVDQLKK